MYRLTFATAEGRTKETRSCNDLTAERSGVLHIATLSARVKEALSKVTLVAAAYVARGSVVCIYLSVCLSGFRVLRSISTLAQRGNTEKSYLCYSGAQIRA